jgi:hypothetical protein
MKSQAETAGRLGDSGDQRPGKGTVLRDVELHLADGSRQLLSQFRGRTNLVIIFAAQGDVIPLLDQLLSAGSELKANAARVLVIGSKPLSQKFDGKDFHWADDPEAILHRQLGAVGDDAQPVATVYITDRFGEVFAGFRESAQQHLPDGKEVIAWLEFINQQCEECSPPEWR